jgi:hypothetical protein
MEAGVWTKVVDVGRKVHLEKGGKRELMVKTCFEARYCSAPKLDQCKKCTNLVVQMVMLFLDLCSH